MGTIFIDRGNRKALLGIGQNMQQALNEGRSVLMFPEGTTSNGLGLLKLHANLFEAAVKADAPVIPIILRYRSRGEITTAPAYVGSVGLFECLWKVVNTPDLSISLSILPPLYGDDRHSLCQVVSQSMSQAMGVPDPLAPGKEL